MAGAARHVAGVADAELHQVVLLPEVANDQVRSGRRGQPGGQKENRKSNHATAGADTAPLPLAHFLHSFMVLND